MYQLKNKGFTLIELLIVMAIIAILTTIGVGNFRTVRAKARDATRKNDLETIAKTLEAYYNDHKEYPKSTADNKIACKDNEHVCEWGEEFSDGANVTQNITVYATKLPKDARESHYYTYISSDGISYKIYANLENKNDPAIDNTITEACSENETCNYKITSSN